jgi:hypothetical protein
MAYLMAQYTGDLVFILKTFQYARRDIDISAGRGKGVDQFIIEDGKRVPQVASLGANRQFLADSVDLLIQLLVRRYPVGLPHLPIGAFPDGDFASLADQNRVVVRTGDEISGIYSITHHNADDGCHDSKKSFHY